jgi:hypothetical protein
MTTIHGLDGAVEACVRHIDKCATVTFMELCDFLGGRYGLPADLCGDEVMTVGHHSIGDGVTMTPMNDPPNVILWNSGSPELFAVVEAILADGRVVLEGTSVEVYSRRGMQLLEDYDEDQDDYSEVPLPAIDFSDDVVVQINADGYDRPHWLPVVFRCRLTGS